MPLPAVLINEAYSRARAECPADHSSPVQQLAVMSCYADRATAISTSPHRSGMTRPRKRRVAAARSVAMAINGDKRGGIGLTNTRFVQSAAGKDG